MICRSYEIYIAHFIPRLPTGKVLLWTASYQNKKKNSGETELESVSITN